MVNVVEIVRTGDPAFPSRLGQLTDAPSLLYHCGRLPDWDRVVAVVGTRRCTSYGRRIARQLASDLARAGVLVLSGLAWGIDAEAHLGALEAGGPTCAIVAGGPDDCHPRSNLPIYRQMLDRDLCILSEYAPGTPLEKWRFRARNRLLAAIAHGVVVVEAPHGSGALLTAHYAADDTAAEVFVVPGPADAPSFAGGHKLLRDGARLVTCARDILDDLGWQAAEPACQGPQGDPEAIRLLSCLESEGSTIDALCLRSRLPYPIVLSVLTTLELQGKVVGQPSGLFLRAARPT